MTHDTDGQTREPSPCVPAAYLSMIQDIWKDEYPEIDGRTAILAT